MSCPEMVNPGLAVRLSQTDRTTGLSVLDARRARASCHDGRNAKYGLFGGHSSNRPVGVCSR